MQRGSSVHKSARIGWIAHDGIDSRRRGPLPPQFARKASSRLPSGQQQPLVSETAQHFLACAECGEAFQHERDGVLDLLVWVFDDAPIGQAHQPGGEDLPIDTLLNLTLPPSLHA